MKEKYQDSLLQEISQLKSTIQQMRQQMAQRDQDHVDEMAALKKQMYAEMN